MKKRLIWILLGLGSLFVILLLVVNNASFQKSMLLDALEDAGFTANAERVSVGLAKGRVEKLLLSNDDITIDVPEVDIEYSLLSLIFSNHIKIEKVYVENFELSLAGSAEGVKGVEGGKPSKPSKGGGGPKQSKEPFQGIFKGWHDSKTKLTVGDVDVKGVVNLEDGGKLLVTLKGGDIRSNTHRT